MSDSRLLWHVVRLDADPFDGTFLCCLHFTFQASTMGHQKGDDCNDASIRLLAYSMTYERGVMPRKLTTTEFEDH